MKVCHGCHQPQITAPFPLGSSNALKCKKWKTLQLCLRHSADVCDWWRYVFPVSLSCPQAAWGTRSSASVSGRRRAGSRRSDVFWTTLTEMRPSASRSGSRRSENVSARTHKCTPTDCLNNIFSQYPSGVLRWSWRVPQVPLHKHNHQTWQLTDF